MVALLVVLTFIAFILVDAFVLKRQRIKEGAEAPLPAPARPAPSFPLGYFFAPGHSWLNLHPSGNVFMGLDEMMHRTIGKASEITLRKKGEKINKGGILAILSRGEKKLQLISPVDGIIEEANTDLEKNPRKGLESPYKKGWFYLISPVNLVEDMKNLVVGEKTKTWWSNELSRLREFAQTSVPQKELAGLTLSDGGIPCDDLVRYFDQKTVEQFETAFLHRKNWEEQEEN